RSRRADPRRREARRSLASHRVRAGYLVVTDAVADPPALLLTVMLPGLTGKLSVPWNEPRPLPVRVPIVWLVAVTNTVSLAAALVLVACTRSWCFDVRYSA